MLPLILLLVFGTIYTESVGLVGGFSDSNPAEFAVRRRHLAFEKLEFQGQAWKSAAEINKGNGGNAYLVPIKVRNRIQNH